jgi:outer membrane protein
LSAQWSGDVSGRSHGQLMDMTLLMPYYKNNFLFAPAIGLSWRNRNLSNYYFGGVTASEATLDIPAYDTGSTLSHQLMLTMGYRLNERWYIGGSVHYEHLDKAIANSPIVQRAEEMSYFLGVGYHWKQ